MNENYAAFATSFRTSGTGAGSRRSADRTLRRDQPNPPPGHRARVGQHAAADSSRADFAAARRKSVARHWIHDGGGRHYASLWVGLPVPDLTASIGIRP